MDSHSAPNCWAGSAFGCILPHYPKSLRADCYLLYQPPTPPASAVSEPTPLRPVPNHELEDDCNTEFPRPALTVSQRRNCHFLRGAMRSKSDDLRFRF